MGFETLDVNEKDFGEGEISHELCDSWCKEE